MILLGMRNEMEVVLEVVGKVERASVQCEIMNLGRSCRQGEKQERAAEEGKEE